MPILKDNLLRLAYVAEAFGCRPSDYHDPDLPMSAYERFCVDEAALLVLSYAKRDARIKAEEEAKSGKPGHNGKRGGGKAKKAADEPPVRVNDEEGFARLKEHAAAALAKVQKRSILR